LLQNYKRFQIFLIFLPSLATVVRRELVWLDVDEGAGGSVLEFEEFDLAELDESLVRLDFVLKDQALILQYVHRLDQIILSLFQ